MPDFQTFTEATERHTYCLLGCDAVEVTERHTYRLLGRNAVKVIERGTYLLLGHDAGLLEECRHFKATFCFLHQGWLRQHFPLNRRYTATRLQDVTPKKRAVFACSTFSKHCGILHKAIINTKNFPLSEYRYFKILILIHTPVFLGSRNDPAAATISYGRQAATTSYQPPPTVRFSGVLGLPWEITNKCTVSFFPF